MICAPCCGSVPRRRHCLPDAVFAVLFEMQHRPRYGPGLRRDVGRCVFRQVRRQSRQPLVDALVQVVERSLRRYPLSLAAARQLVAAIAPHRCPSALAIVEAAVGWSDLAALESDTAAIRAAWQT
jgi:hypothetical protein